MSVFMIEYCIEPKGKWQLGFCCESNDKQHFYDIEGYVLDNVYNILIRQDMGCFTIPNDIIKEYE